MCDRRASQETATDNQSKKHGAEIASLQQALLSQQQNADANLEMLQKQINLTKKKADLQRKQLMGTVESQLAALRRRFTAKEKEVDQLQKANKKLLLMNKDLRAKCARHEESLQKACGEKDGDTLRLRDQISNLKQRCMHLQTSYDEERHQNTELEQRLSVFVQGDSNNNTEV